jgi:hypothetical protein
LLANKLVMVVDRFDRVESTLDFAEAADRPGDAMPNIDALLATMRVICASPKLKYFRIGYTSWSANRKRGVYGKRHLVILADRLTRKAALKLEQALQERACGIGGKRCDRSSILYCKYDPKRRDGRYWKSNGGNKADAGSPVHAVYMVWKTAR